MRAGFLHIAIVFFGSIILFSCQKEYSYESGALAHDSVPVIHDSVPVHDSVPADGGLDTFRVTIDGRAWVAQTITASAISGQVGISGSDVGGTPSVSLIMPVYIAQGNTYNLDVTSEMIYIGVYNPSGVVALPSTGGGLTILENNPTSKRIRGNFHFQASDPAGVNSRKGHADQRLFLREAQPLRGLAIGGVGLGWLGWAGAIFLAGRGVLGTL